MLCPNCSYNNPDNLRYCRNCDIDLQPEPAETPIEVPAQELPYASLVSRLLATFLDLLLILAFALILMALLLGVTIITGVDSLLYDNFTLTTFMRAIAVIAAGYFVVLDGGSNKGTYGKRWLNLAVHNPLHEPIGILRSLLRLLLKLATLPLLPLLLIQPFTPHKQALHDMVAGSVVTRTTTSKKVSVMAPLLVLFIALMVPVTALMATAGIPFFLQYIQQVQLEKGIKIGHMVSAGVERYYRANGQVPATLEETHTPVKSPLISAIAINPKSGEITLTFSSDARKNLRDRHLLFTPSQTEDQGIVWRCHSNDIENYLLTDVCN